ncbi:PepSY-associated TM helix domain-containing protein [Massilia sp. DWR3-1-1]|uniref:PepSY-associated TM helix domain-containing protein n=1 Tax=Massilia sp. DWR3-1-1 TaxID=2804559 RepID=UPI003CFA0EF8
MRPFWTLIHRYLGLFTAAFLFVSGVTGAIISWDHELDDLLNPQLMQAGSRGPAQAPLALAQAVESRYPHLRVTYLPLHAQPGDSLALGIGPRVDGATGKLYAPGFNQLFLDPVSGAELGRREWGAVWPITRETFVSFLYKLHYTLHIPAFWGIDRWGVWLMGAVAVVWLFDSFVGFYLTLPGRRKAAPAASAASGKSWWRRWQPAWLLRWSAGGARLNFDLHRAFSLWTWALLFVLAFTAFSLNLYTEVFYPVLKTVSTVTPSPFDTIAPHDADHPIEPAVAYPAIVQTASAEAARRGWPAPAGAVFYSPEFGVYGVSFFQPGDDHGAGGVGPPYLYYDGAGRLLGERQPWKGTVADIFVQAQFPLHSGRILGLPGRILISLMGLVVAMLSVTGVLIWWRKRAARRAVLTRPVPARTSLHVS